MIVQINGDLALVRFFSGKVEENGVNVILDPSFYLPDGSLDTDKIANVAVDSYYNSLKIGDTPPSIDNLIVIGRGNGFFSLYLIELKSVKRMKYLNSNSIKKKFDTSINDFMSTRFQNIFLKSGTRLSDLNLWLICNKFDYMGTEISRDDYEKRIKNTIVEKLLLIQPFRFGGKLAAIQSMPSETPIF
jgi:hypothetical protein